jgi:hypothetical protein
MRNASAKSLGMKAPSNINLPTQAGDVIVNPRHPENPDSKPMAAAYKFSNNDYLLKSFKFHKSVIQTTA